MRQLQVLVLALLAAMALGAPAKRKAPKPPDLEVLEASARHSGDNIQIDGRVRNTGEKPIRGLTLVFDFLNSDKVPVTTQKAPIDEEFLATGHEAPFRVELAAPPRAISILINAVAEGGRDLRVAKPGPFPIE